MNDARAYAKQQADARDRLRAKQAAEDLAGLMDMPAFRRFVLRQFDFTKLFGSEFHQDSRQHALNSGMRFIGQRLMDEIGAVTPAGLTLLLKEKYEAQVAEQQAQRVDMTKHSTE